MSSQCTPRMFSSEHEQVFFLSKYWLSRLQLLAKHLRQQTAQSVAKVLLLRDLKVVLKLLNEVHANLQRYLIEYVDDCQNTERQDQATRPTSSVHLCLERLYVNNKLTTLLSDYALSALPPVEAASEARQQRAHDIEDELHAIERLQALSSSQRNQLCSVVQQLRQAEHDVAFHARLAKDVDSACAAGGYSSTNFAYGSTPYSSWLQLMQHPEVAPSVHAAMGTHSRSPAPAAAATNTCLDSMPHALPSDSCSDPGDSSRHASSAAAAPSASGSISTAAEPEPEPTAAQQVSPAPPTASASSSQPAQHKPLIFMVWGSSTGWLPLYAAITYGWRCQGYELLASLVEQAQQVAGRSEVQQPVEFYAADMLSSSLADVRVLMLTDQCWDAALVVKVINKLREELPPGAVVIEYTGCLAPLLQEEVLQQLAVVQVASSWNAQQSMHVYRRPV